MTQQARVVLQDCGAALEELKAGATGNVFRIRWVAAVCLLRTVGHVLDKVDARSSPAMAAAIKAAYDDLKRTKPEPRVYWDFIEAERNNVVKTYQFGAKESVTMQPVASHRDMYGRRTSRIIGPITHNQFLDSGPFAGRSPAEVLQEAMAWWFKYLDHVDEEARSRAHASA